MPGTVQASNIHFTSTGTTRLALEGSNLVATASNVQLNANTTIQKQLILNGIITPTTLATDQHNYAPTGFENCNVIRIDLTADVSITGIAGGTDGRIIVIENIDTADWFITLEHENASSLAENRIVTPDDFAVVLRNGINAILRYDGISQRWRILSRPASRASTADMESNSSLSAFVPAAYTERAPSAAKVWVVGTTNSTTIIASYNVTSLGDTATGQQTVTIATDFSSANYCVLVGVDDTLGTLTLVNGTSVSSRAVGSYIMNSVVEGGSGDDPLTAWHSIAFGDQ